MGLACSLSVCTRSAIIRVFCRGLLISGRTIRRCILAIEVTLVVWAASISLLPTGGSGRLGEHNRRSCQKEPREREDYENIILRARCHRTSSAITPISQRTLQHRKHCILWQEVRKGGYGPLRYIRTEAATPSAHFLHEGSLMSRLKSNRDTQHRKVCCRPKDDSFCQPSWRCLPRGSLPQVWCCLVDRHGRFVFVIRLLVG